MTHDALDKTSTKIMQWLSVAPIDSASPVSEEDVELIPVVAEAALSGEDIRQMYPHFWRELTERAQLRIAFLQVVAVLEAPIGQQPRVSSSRLAEELARIPPMAQVRQYSPERWVVNWLQTAGQVNYQFQQYAETTRLSRRFRSYTDEQTFTMLRADVTLESGELNVLLELTRSADLLLFYPIILVSFDPAPAIPARSLVAALAWGDYAERRLLHSDTLAFPPVPRTAVTDPATDEILYDLHLSIETLL